MEDGGIFPRRAVVVGPNRSLDEATKTLADRNEAEATPETITRAAAFSRRTGIHLATLTGSALRNSISPSSSPKSINDTCYPVDEANRLREDRAARRLVKGSRWLLLRNRENVTAE